MDFLTAKIKQVGELIEDKVKDAVHQRATELVNDAMENSDEESSTQSSSSSPSSSSSSSEQVVTNEMLKEKFDELKGKCEYVLEEMMEFVKQLDSAKNKK